MDKKIILAVAGSGKTYHLVHSIDKNKRNIIIAYTNQNIKNIQNELIKKFGNIPTNTFIMTFHSFVYRFMIRPFDSMIGAYYNKEYFRSKGISIEKPPVSSFDKNGKRIQNKFYKKDNTLEHYLDNEKFYSDYLAKLIIKTNNKKFKLINQGCNTLSRFFDCIYIDEVQDFREYNWKLLTEIIKKVDKILLVGDYNQHSVSAINNSGIPFKIHNNCISYDNYKDYLNDLGLILDETSLSKSRRCSSDVCTFIKNKLRINIESENINNGIIKYIDNYDEIDSILKENKIIKLVYESPEKYNFNAISWSYSKGDTYDNICIILTKNYSDITEDNYICDETQISRNKLYVALTRSKGNVYIIKAEDFEAYMNKNNVLIN